MFQIPDFAYWKYWKNPSISTGILQFTGPPGPKILKAIPKTT
jgi:hypothetical protein